MTSPDPLISVEAMAARPSAEVCVVDCRFTLADPGQGHREYLAGHLPGAHFADLDRDLSALPAADPGSGRHPLPAPQTLAAALGRWGWRPGMTVVAYDAGGGAMVAARLWWLMRMAGLPAQVLDGGLAAWRAAGKSLHAGAVAVESSAPTLRLDTSRIVDTPSLQARLAEGTMCLIDARGAVRYRGDEEPIDRVGGHVPGALSRPFADNLTADGRFRPATELREDFRALIGDAPADIVAHMCGSGVTACHNLLAMEVAGLSGSQLYPASWSGWSSDPVRPVATGTRP